MSRFTRTPRHTERARSLRRRLTKAERRLWQILRGAQLGESFRRQHPIGRYVVDFYCAPLKLAIELDGAQHARDERRDAHRTAHLNAQGVEVLRFWNVEVAENIDGVASKFAQHCKNAGSKRLNPTPS